jgi:hypothetical protein
VGDPTEVRVPHIVVSLLTAVGADAEITVHFEIL